MTTSWLARFYLFLRSGCSNHTNKCKYGQKRIVLQKEQEKGRRSLSNGNNLVFFIVIAIVLIDKPNIYILQIPL